MTVFTTSSAEETKELGKRIAKQLKPGDVVAIVGELGTGKTTFVQGLAEGLGVSKGIRSPSFIILNVHKGRLKLYHLDLYRVRDINELYE
ncbi:MAG: tRNA (adenosine(37)-N6)-threonylcarbamoyltransferase complex ATPase subunit type 1 TsaE, partial [Deltaproteobacteria bacterium]|nr:tRNA (adenosine(37)-N6)-threonylcarbamoyltransferase complex ATPase subunit type 1 TsaE [Deltaproteobacteria bacterium]